MKQVLQYNREQMPRVEDIPSPGIKGSGLVVSNRCSLISAGTEREMIGLSRMSLAGKARQRPDMIKQVLTRVRTEGLVSTYNKVRERLETPIPLGYSSAGVVKKVHSSLERWTPGERVACAGYGYACHAEIIYVPTNLAVKIPGNVTFEEASFVTLGAVAMQGIRIADVHLGETVAVIGLGLLGQLTCRLLSASGCRVVGLDIDENQLGVAQRGGIDRALLADDAAIPGILNLTSGKGVDSVIITAATDSAAPVETAGSISRDRGIVVVVGSVRLDIPRKMFYEKELELRFSRSYGPGRYDYYYEEAGRDYPYGYVRWTENRNMESFLQLISTGRIDVRDLITHRFDIGQADKAYNLISNQTSESYLGVLLSHPGESAVLRNRLMLPKNKTAKLSRSSKIQVGFVGAGNFATGVLLPNMRSIGAYENRAIMSGSGVSAFNAAKRFGFKAAVSTFEEIIGDSEIGAIFIGNRHNQHAQLVIKSLLAGKPTFVEKPLCLNREELEQIRSAYMATEAPLMVGYNRRFAPVIGKIRESLKAVRYPISMHYRINAGFIPTGNWIQDPDCGGGRVIGEICHFVDLLSYLSGARPVKVHAEALSMPNERFRCDDNLQLVIRFSNGSVGTINYVASGNKAVPKEFLEVIGGGLTIQMNDFRTLSIAGDKGLQMDKKRNQDKGHRKMLELWSHYLTADLGSPISFNSLFDTSLTTFEILESLSGGEPRWISA
jgi:predicted dehydrogenase/threonine dehydrogenase-like Zn-dependent dehydrogenase